MRLSTPLRNLAAAALIAARIAGVIAGLIAGRLAGLISRVRAPLGAAWRGHLRTGVASALTLLAAVAPAKARDLVLLSMSPYPTQEMQVFQPFADHLAAQLKALGIAAGKVLVVPDIESAAAALRAGRADLYIGSPYPVLAIGELSGSRPVLRRWKEGKVEYHTLIVARSGSPLTSLRSLAGKRVAFETAYSTSAYFLPKSELERLGLRLHALSHAASTPPADEVGYVFAGDRDNAAAWLLRDRVDAAAFGTHDWESLKPREREQMRIVHQTPPIPRQMVSLRADLEPALAAAIVAALKRMDGVDDGRRALVTFERTTRFDDLPPEAVRTLDAMRALVRQSLRPKQPR